MNQLINIAKFFLRPSYKFYKSVLQRIHRKKEIKRLYNITKAVGYKPRIFYFGICEHSNLGDMAQFYCIHKWINKNYPEYDLHEFEASVVVDKPNNRFVPILKNTITKNDIIIFQSGFTTTDRGLWHEIMHRLVIDNIPEANILMMPQTILFEKEKNKIRTSKSYNQAKNMLFLARDMISFDMANEMFPDITVKAFPDIVTTLIGKYHFNQKREGVYLCCRNDREKYYSDDEINKLHNRLVEHTKVEMGDTSIKSSYKTIRNDLQNFIENIIAQYSKYKVIITDRYHGTIFSLAANTPVIIIKTSDHKVVTGADWFKGVYDDYVYVSESLDDAYTKALEIIEKSYNYKLEPYFDANYYNNLKEIATETFKK